MKITKEEFDSLYNPDISKRKYDEIIAKIDARFYEIVTTLLPNLKKKGWCDYGNCNYQSEDSNGYFDPDEYKKEIVVGGEYACLPKPYDCDNSFPTRWLWEDTFKEEFDQKVKKYQEDLEKEKLEKEAKAKYKELEKAKFRNIIESKLTKEELKYITFK